MRRRGHRHIPRSISYSPDGRLLACGDRAGVTILSRPEAQEVAQLHLEDQGVEVIAFSPDGTHLAAGFTRHLAVWELAGRSLVATGEGHTHGTRGLVWLPDGQGLLSAGWDSTIRWWAPDLAQAAAPLWRRVLLWQRAAPGQPRQSLRVAEPIMSLIVSPDGRTAVAGGHRTLILCKFDQVRGQWSEQQRVEAVQPIFALAITADGQRLAVGHNDGRIFLGDLTALSQTGDLTGHEWSVSGLAFTPDGSRLVSGSADGTVRLWDVPSRRLLQTYRFHDSWVSCVAVSPDGMTAATGGADGVLVMWDLADV